MKTKLKNDDLSKIDKILTVIAKDDELSEQFAQAIGEDLDEFNQWIDKVKVF